MEKKIRLNKKTLFICSGAYPPNSGTSIIVFNLLEQFHPEDIVLAGEQSHDSDLTDWTLPSYPVILLEHNYPFGKKGSRFLIWTQYFKVKREVAELVEKHKIECIVGIFPTEFYQFVGAVLAKNLNLPFCSWFHNTYYDNRDGILKFLAKFIQPYIFKNSVTIFNMSEGMNQYMKKKYPSYSKKFSSLLHGFDIPTVGENLNLEIGKKVKFLMTGNVNHSNIDATQRLAKTVLKNENYHLDIYTNTDQKVLNGLGLKSKNLRINSFVPLKELVSKFKEYDIILLAHGFGGDLTEAEYKTIFPTRTIPLLYAQKPILAHSPPDVNITHFLENNQCAVVVKEKSELPIIQAIQTLIRDRELRIRLVKNAIKTSRQFDSKKTAAFLQKNINERLSQ